MAQVEKMWKAIQEAKCLDAKKNYALRFTELIELINVADVNRPEGVCSAFNYGFIKGIRYQKAQEKRGKGSCK